MTTADRRKKLDSISGWRNADSKERNGIRKYYEVFFGRRMKLAVWSSVLAATLGAAVGLLFKKNISAILLSCMLLGIAIKLWWLWKKESGIRNMIFSGKYKVLNAKIATLKKCPDEEDSYAATLISEDGTCIDSEFIVKGEFLRTGSAVLVVYACTGKTGNVFCQALTPWMLTEEENGSIW